MKMQPEFQAVVLAAGRGSRISELTAGKPKCLLPVGPLPLAYYPLHKLQTAGFAEALMVVLEAERADVQHALDRTDLDIRIEYFCLPEADGDLGTAESLKLASERISSDVIVVSCDLVTDVSLKGALDLFRMHSASVVSVLAQPPPGEVFCVPGPKSKTKPERDLIGIDATTGRMVFLASASDFESDVSLPAGLVKKHTSLKMFSGLVDCHVYVIKKWVLDYLRSAEGFTSLKGELLPHVIRKQLSKAPKVLDTTASGFHNAGGSDIFEFARRSDDDAVKTASSYNDHFGDLRESYHGDAVRCYAYVAPKEEFGVRVNTLSSYWWINNKIGDKWASIFGRKDLVRVHPKAEVKSTQVDDRCVVWEAAKLAEKTSFKNSNIGSNTKVSSFSRVFNSIVMDNVVIGEKVAIENCIVCDGAIVENGCQIKNCLIGSQHVVPEQSEHSDEVLTESDRLMEF